MTEKRFKYIMFDGFEDNGEYLNPQEVVKILNELYEENQSSKEFIEQLQKELVLFKKAGADMDNDLNAQITALKEENEQLKKGMIEVVDRYIKNVECNPPSSARTYMKIKRALDNIREDLRSLIEDFE